MYIIHIIYIYIIYIYILYIKYIYIFFGNYRRYACSEHFKHILY